MLRRILVPLDSSDYTAAATRMAAHISERGKAAGHDDAQLLGLGIVDLQQIPTGRFAGIINRDELVREAEQTVDGLMDEFRKRATGFGVANERILTRKRNGAPFREIIRESVFSDVIVMGERCSYPPVQYDYDTLHNLYHEASRPLFITDFNFRPVKRVVLAMDGTAPSSRMLYHYMHINPFPQAEVVLAYSSEEQAQYDLGDFFERVQTCLGENGYTVRMVTWQGNFDEAITDLVNQEDADLLALGVHREQFARRLTDPLHIREDFAKRLLKRITATLMMVN